MYAKFGKAARHLCDDPDDADLKKHPVREAVGCIPSMEPAWPLENWLTVFVEFPFNDSSAESVMLYEIRVFDVQCNPRALTRAKSRGPLPLRAYAEYASMAEAT